MQICSPRVTPSPRRSNPQTLTLREKIMNKVNNSDNHKRELFVHLFIDLFICLLEWCAAAQSPKLCFESLHLLMRILAFPRRAVSRTQTFTICGAVVFAHAGAQEMKGSVRIKKDLASPSVLMKTSSRCGFWINCTSTYILTYEGPALLFTPRVKPLLNLCFKKNWGGRVEELLGVSLVNTYLEVNDRCLTSLRNWSSIP